MSDFASLDLGEIGFGDSLDSLLRTIVEQDQRIIGMYVLSMEGMIISSYSLSKLNTMDVSAISATLLSIGSALCSQHKNGGLEQGVLCYENSNFIVLPGGNELIVAMETTTYIDLENFSMPFPISI